MKHIVACVFGLSLVGSGATLYPPSNLAVFIALSSPPPAMISEFDPTGQLQTITGKVVGVLDGDTFTVLDASNKQYKIGLLGIDAPEINQAFGSRAKQGLSNLILGRVVTVTSVAKDMYGRALSDVTLNGKNVNLEQVRRGFAWFYRFYAKELRTEDVTAYRQAEERARKGKLGLWADLSPTPPWDYRLEKNANAPGMKPLMTGPIVGDRSSKIYHLPYCPDFTKVSRGNIAPFKTEAEARAAGYTKAKNCPQ